MKRIFFPGSFNPFTKGHADILKRLLTMAEYVTIGIGVNIEKRDSTENAKANLSSINDFLRKEGLDKRVNVIAYTGLTGEEALKIDADCLARGVRNSADFEYEYQLACINRDAFSIETILIPADPGCSFVSSTALRDFQKHGRNDLAENYLP